MPVLKTSLLIMMILFVNSSLFAESGIRTANQGLTPIQVIGMFIALIALIILPAFKVPRKTVVK